MLDDFLLTTAISHTLDEWKKMREHGAQRETRILSDLLGVLFVQSLLPVPQRASLKHLLREIQKVSHNGRQDTQDNDFLCK